MTTAAPSSTAQAEGDARSLLSTQARVLANPRRYAVFARIADSDSGATVTELCGWFPLTRNAVREHLAKLLVAGLLREEVSLPTGPGRPAHRYRATPAATLAWRPGGPFEQLSIYDAAMRYQAEGVALIVVAGAEYGSGSSRDWAAKGTALLGVRAVLAESFERIHRSNLIGMGVLPLQFQAGQSAASLGLTGYERFDIDGVAAVASATLPTSLVVRADDREFSVDVRIDTPVEMSYYCHGGILPYVLRHLHLRQRATT